MTTMALNTTISETTDSGTTGAKEDGYSTLPPEVVNKQFYCFKMINCNTFYSNPSIPKYPFVECRDRSFNLIDMAICSSSTKPVAPAKSSFDDTFSDDLSSWRLGIKLPEITKMAKIDGTILLLLSDEELMFIPLEAIGRWYTGELPYKTMPASWFKSIGNGKVSGFKVGQQIEKYGEDPVDYLFFWKDKTIQFVDMSGISGNWSTGNNSFKRSRNEVIRFSFDVTGAAFDPAEHALTLTGNQNFEVWKVPLDKNARCVMVSYAIGNDVRLVHSLPGEIIVAMNRRGEEDIHGNQLILHLQQVK
ncbi:unnamed protein product [Ambrosiozyma monospora]|uniref:Unnamed protein product n=1 Tax=Ambrosiozyma monospora TaxID=43982 RepID=A0ACB5T9D4_AMBMO|nr:unnamed protein product [Ambrosiozyma monospora]